MKTAVGLFLAAFCVQNVFSQEDPGFVGTEICATCHEAEFAAWQNSHHDLAMQDPTPKSVLGDFDDALTCLKEAADLEEGGSHYRYVYAVALHDLGQVSEAIEQLRIALERSRYSQDVLYALAAYSFEIARYADARAYAAELVSFYPDNDAYLRLNRRIKTLGQE